MATDTALPFIIHLFGPFEVLCAGQPMRPLRSQKGKWLLALLALRHGQEVQRLWLAETLWLDSEHEKALASLGQSLFDLRRALGADATRLSSPTSRSLHLDLTDADVDVVAFDRAIAKGAPADLEAAVALYRGPFLEDCSESWAHYERESRRQAYLRALETLSTRALGDGAPEMAIRYLERAVVADLWQQTAHRTLMQVLANAGNLDAALRVYHTLRQRLHDEQNADPDPDTTALYQQIRMKVRRPARSKDPSHTHSPSVSAAPCRLPTSLTALVGREREIQQVTAYLLSARLVTLTGPGGVGKTRLAIQVAREMAEDYRDGVWFVSLESLTNPALVSQTVATGVGAPAAPGLPWDEALASFLRSKQALLVLDNCEHLTEVCAQLARVLLRECSRLHLLATSREKLGLMGEVVWRVPSLAFPDIKAAPYREDQHRYPAVRLFYDRAVAVRPGFVLSAGNAQTVAAICRRLDGLPLAIELATALLEVLSEEDIARRLDDRFRLLTGGDRTAPKRHQTLQAALDWSYSLLSEPERTLLRRLCVFAGGWSLLAAETVCHGESIKKEDVLPLLSRLVSKSLVTVEERAGTRRYRLLETIREYGRACPRDALAELRHIQEAHCSFFVSLAEAAELEIQGAGQAEWLDRLEQDIDNLRTALTRSVHEYRNPDGALRLAGALWGFWYARSYHQEGQDWLERVLRMESAGSAPLRLKAVLGAGNLAYAQRDYPRARSYFDAYRTLAHELGDTRAHAAALASLANVEAGEQNYAQARAHFEESLDLFKTLNDRRGVALTLANLAIVACEEKDYAAARGLHLRSLSLFREMNSLQNVALELNNLIHTLLCMEDYQEIPSLLAESLALSQTLDSKRILAHCLTNSLTLAVRLGQMPRASVIIGASHALREEIAFPLPDQALPAYQRDCESVRSALGDVVYEAACERGRSMPLPQLLAFLQALPETSCG